MALKFLRSYKVTLAAGVSRALDVDGDYFNVLASDQDTFELGFDNGPTTVMEQGFSGKVGYNGDPFRTVTVVNTNASSLTVTIALGFGELWDNKATLTGAIAVDGGDGLAAAEVAVTDEATEIVAAASGRRSLLVKNVGSDTCYIGPSDVTDADGFPLEAGESITLYNVGANYAICAAAGSTTLRYLAEL